MSRTIEANEASETMRKRVETLEAALRTVRARLQPYMDLPADRYPGPPVSIIDDINGALYNF